MIISHFSAHRREWFTGEDEANGVEGSGANGKSSQSVFPAEIQEPEAAAAHHHA